MMNFNVLLKILRKENIEELKEIISKAPKLLQAKDKNGRSLLHYCAEHQSVLCAEYLITKDPSLLEERDNEGYTPLHLCTINGNQTITRFLVAKSDTDYLNSCDNEQHTAIHWATVCGELECLDILIDAKANPSTSDMHGAYPIHYAAQMCSPHSGICIGNNTKIGLAILKKLIQNLSVDVNCTDNDGRTPLLWTASAGSSDAILALVNAGADVSARDKDGLSAIHCAASRGHIDCIETLISLCGAEVDQMDANGCTPLYYAVTLGHADCAQLLIKFGANVNHQDCKGRTSVHCGASKGQLECIKILASQGANIWTRNFRGDLPLHEAVKSGRKELVRWFLEPMPSAVNAANTSGRTPLHVAAFSNNIEMCKILIDKGADVNTVMKVKGHLFTPLDACLQKGYRGVAKFLLLHGALPAARLSQRYEKTSLQRSISGEPQPFDRILSPESTLNSIAEYSGKDSLLDTSNPLALNTDDSSGEVINEISFHHTLPKLPPLVSHCELIKHDSASSSSSGKIVRNITELKELTTGLDENQRELKQAIITNVYVTTPTLPGRNKKVPPLKKIKKKKITNGRKSQSPSVLIDHSQEESIYSSRFIKENASLVREELLVSESKIAESENEITSNELTRMSNKTVSLSEEPFGPQNEKNQDFSQKEESILLNDCQNIANAITASTSSTQIETCKTNGESNTAKLIVECEEEKGQSTITATTNVIEKGEISKQEHEAAINVINKQQSLETTKNDISTTIHQLNRFEQDMEEKHEPGYEPDEDYSADFVSDSEEATANTTSPSESAKTDKRKREKRSIKSNTGDEQHPEETNFEEDVESKNLSDNEESKESPNGPLVLNSKQLVEENTSSSPLESASNVLKVGESVDRTEFQDQFLADESKNLVEILKISDVEPVKASTRKKASTNHQSLVEHDKEKDLTTNQVSPCDKDSSRKLFNNSDLVMPDADYDDLGIVENITFDTQKEDESISQGLPSFGSENSLGEDFLRMGNNSSLSVTKKIKILPPSEKPLRQSTSYDSCLNKSISYTFNRKEMSNVNSDFALRKSRSESRCGHKYHFKPKQKLGKIKTSHIGPKVDSNVMECRSRSRQKKQQKKDFDTHSFHGNENTQQIFVEYSSTTQTKIIYKTTSSENIENLEEIFTRDFKESKSESRASVQKRETTKTEIKKSTVSAKNKNKTLSTNMTPGGPKKNVKITPSAGQTQTTKTVHRKQCLKKQIEIQPLERAKNRPKFKRTKMTIPPKQTLSAPTEVISKRWAEIRAKEQEKLHKLRKVKSNPELKSPPIEIWFELNKPESE